MVSFRHVFIDLDDTLWNFRDNSHRALKVVYDQFSLDSYYPEFEDFYRTYSEKNAELWNLYHHGRLTREELIAERFRYPLQRRAFTTRHHTATQSGLPLGTFRAGRPAFLCP